MSFQTLKQELYESFANARERGHTDNHSKLARRCIEAAYHPSCGWGVHQRYTLVPFMDILRNNNFEYNKIGVAYNVILGYVASLLGPSLLPRWWIITTKNSNYQRRLAPVRGAERVLEIAGYTQRKGDNLMFPEQTRPQLDQRHIASLATEILLASIECEDIGSGRYCPDQLAMPGNVPRQGNHPRIDSTFGFDDFDVPRPSDSFKFNSSSPLDSVYISPTLPSEFAGGGPYNLHTESPQYSGPYAGSSQYFGPHAGSSQYSGPHAGSSQYSGPHAGSSQYSGSHAGSSQYSGSHAGSSQYSGSHAGSSQYSGPHAGSSQYSGPHTEVPRYSGPYTEVPQYSGPHTEVPRYSSPHIESPHSSKDDLANSSQNLHSQPSSIPHDVTTSHSDTTNPPETNNKKDKAKRLLERFRSYTVNDPSEQDITPTKKCFSTPNLLTAAPPMASSLATPPGPPRPIPKPRKRKTVRIDPIPEDVDSYDGPSNTPASPTKCLTCKNTLDQSGSCSYCTSDNYRPDVYRPPPGSVTAPVSKPPVPVPRTKLRQVAPQPPQDNRNPPGVSVPSSNNQRPPDDYQRPRVSSGPLVPPKAFDATSQQTNQPHLAASKATPHSPLPQHRVDRLAEELQYKYNREIEYFRKLSPKEQCEYLDDKRSHKETVTHLTPYYQGNDLHLPQHARERRREEEDITFDEQAVDRDLERRQKEKRQQKQKEDGQYFVQCIKLCAEYNFDPKEVEIALQNNRDDPLEFLMTEWLKRIENHKHYVKFKCKVGEPSQNESRLLLIETKGNYIKAGDLCIQRRKEKIEELASKVKGKFEVEEDDLIQTLSTCQLDVMEAFYALQCHRLKDVYEYLTSDYSKVTQGKPEMDFMKAFILEKIKGKDKESYQFKSCLRMVMCEFRLGSFEKAEIFVKLLEEEQEQELPLKYYIDATKNFLTYDEAKKYLNQPCSLCLSEYPMDEMVVMPACGESLCKNCFIGNFSITIKEQSVKHFNCPLCGLPDLSNPSEMQDLNLELFVSMIKHHLKKDEYELCQKKLTDFNLSKEEGFVWCQNDKCQSGFINEVRNRNKIDCPSCNQSMCFLCKKKWEDQHDGISCEDFAQWKTMNDPEAQKAGLAAHLKENGIQCPRCKFRYDLARGGCMHFRCTQCPAEFCSGCYGIFKKAEDCGKFEDCKNKGFHAHHPRDCLFYLRDFDVKTLQDLLNKNTIIFDTEPPEAQVKAAKEKKEAGVADPPVPVEAPPPKGGVAPPPLNYIHVIDGEEIKLVCQVMLQKEGPDGLKDEECLNPAPVGMAGLCSLHYKEYLVDKINKNNLDPVELYENPAVILIREKIEVPQREDNDDDDEYRAKVVEAIKENIPLKKKKL